MRRVAGHQKRGDNPGPFPPQPTRERSDEEHADGAEQGLDRLDACRPRMRGENGGKKHRVPRTAHEAVRLVVRQSLALSEVVGEHEVLDLVNGERFVDPVAECEGEPKDQREENR